LNRDVATESPKPRRHVLAPLQRLRRRPTAPDDSKHGGVAGHVISRHVTDSVLPVIDERSPASSFTGDFRNGVQNGRRNETLLDAMHKKYYPGQYGVVTGSDVRTSATNRDCITPGRMKDDSADCRSATTTSIVGDSLDGAIGRASPNHVTGNYESIQYNTIQYNTCTNIARIVNR